MYGILPSVIGFLRRQLLYVGVALAVHGILWALGLPVNIFVTLIYSLCLSNMAVAVMEHVSCFYSQRRFPYDWLAFLLLLLVLTPFIVTITIGIVYWVMVVPPRPAFWSFLSSGWKFPSMVTLVFGILYNLYRDTKERLERRNSELQATVNLEVAERGLQERELQHARQIQQDLLPQEIPQVAGFEVAGCWEPARVVGGDYFDVLRLSESRLAICIADVAGKSVSAALLMANVQATVRAFASESASPAWLCNRVNSVLCTNTAPEKFVTFFYGILDADEQILHYANAGHLPPILLKPTGAAQPLADSGGAVLGVFRDWSYQDAVLPLSCGDRLILFTDGITEAMRHDGEEFGEQRLIAAARSAANGSPAELQTRIMEQVKSFCHAQLHDDATLLVVSVAGQPVESPRPSRVRSLLQTTP